MKLVDSRISQAHRTCGAHANTNTKMMLGSILLVALFAGGCITESKGGFPEPQPDDARVQAHLELARGYLGKKEWTRARNPLNKALAINSKSVEAHVLMGFIYEREKEPTVAEKHYKLALKNGPKNAQTLNNYGSFLYSQGRTEEALTLLRRAVKDTEYHSRAQAFENLGLAELRATNVDKAKTAFKRATEFKKPQPRSSLELADMAFGVGDFTAAQSYYDDFKNTARQTPRSLCLGMNLSSVQRDTDQVASYRLALKNLYPNSAAAKNCTVAVQ